MKILREVSEIRGLRYIAQYLTPSLISKFEERPYDRTKLALMIAARIHHIRKQGGVAVIIDRTIHESNS